MSSDFFEAMYAGAAGNDAEVPWQHAISRRLIGEWLERFEPVSQQRALVVAAGLGDDAAALAARGLDVVAFDYAPTAMEWARSRHPDANVDWQVADLFAPPVGWAGSFDLVVEVFTIQSIDPANQPKAAATIQSFARPGGTLVAVALINDDLSSELQGPPWPLRPSTLDVLTGGLIEVDRRIEVVNPNVSAILVELTRPLPHDAANRPPDA